jgi:hypothetical protein
MSPVVIGVRKALSSEGPAEAVTSLLGGAAGTDSGNALTMSGDVVDHEEAGGVSMGECTDSSEKDGTCGSTRLDASKGTPPSATAGQKVSVADREGLAEEGSQAGGAVQEAAGGELEHGDMPGTSDQGQGAFSGDESFGHDAPVDASGDHMVVSGDYQPLEFVDVGGGGSGEVATGFGGSESDDTSYSSMGVGTHEGESEDILQQQSEGGTSDEGQGLDGDGAHGDAVVLVPAASKRREGTHPGGEFTMDHTSPPVGLVHSSHCTEIGCKYDVRVVHDLAEMSEIQEEEPGEGTKREIIYFDKDAPAPVPQRTVFEHLAEEETGGCDVGINKSVGSVLCMGELAKEQTGRAKLRRGYT